MKTVSLLLVLCLTANALPAEAAKADTVLTLQQVKEEADSTLLPYHVREEDISSVPVTNIVDKVALQALGGSLTGLLNRISGISFVNGTLVSFRGLNPRYTNVTLDGLAAPITEQNIKAFTLGLLPGSALQGLYVYKSGSYINQGEWGGAVLDISTDAGLDKNYTRLSFGLNYQHNFTFNDFIKDIDHESKFGDVFGYGVDRRDYTHNIAGREELQAMDRNDASAEGAKLRNNWALENVTALPTIELGFNMGRILMEKGERKLATINSVSYFRKQTGTHVNRATYFGYEFNEQGEAISSKLRDYATDGVYTTDSDIAVNSSWNYQHNDDHAFNLDLIYSHAGANRTLSKYYVGTDSDKEAFFAQYGLLAKGIFLARLRGEHEFGVDTDVNWSLGFGNSTRNEPDLRRTAAQRTLGATEEPFLLVIPESSKADVGARFNSDMNDVSYSGRIDLDHDFIDDRFELKAGFLLESNDREFAARIITAAKDDFTRSELRFVKAADLDIVFSPEHFGPDGYTLVDGTTDFEFYDADNLLLAGYLGVDNAFGVRWQTSLGLRIENFQQNLLSGDVNIDNPSTDYLPYFNASYLLGPQTVLKFSYSQSVNRPAFRELSPFIFYDFDYRADIQGNPDLLNASLYNIDFSFLHNFGRNEYFSVSPFYKKINHPIEMIYIIRSDRPLFTFNNTEEADLAGVEVEFSKFLSDSEDSPLYNLLFNGNFSYTQSSIQLGEGTNEAATTRPLQGQIPLLFSAGLTYIGNDKKSQATLAYKFVGKSLFSVGDGQETFPWYNAPVNLLNASFTYTLTDNLEINLTALNLLNTRFSQFEDTNLNGKINDSVDKEVQRALKYQSYNLILSYNF